MLRKVDVAIVYCGDNWWSVMLLKDYCYALVLLRAVVDDCDCDCDDDDVADAVVHDGGDGQQLLVWQLWNWLPN